MNYKHLIAYLGQSKQAPIKPSRFVELSLNDAFWDEDTVNRIPGSSFIDERPHDDLHKQLIVPNCGFGELYYSVSHKVVFVKKSAFSDGGVIFNSFNLSRNIDRIYFDKVTTMIFSFSYRNIEDGKSEVEGLVKLEKFLDSSPGVILNKYYVLDDLV